VHQIEQILGRSVLSLNSLNEMVEALGRRYENQLGMAAGQPCQLGSRGGVQAFANGLFMIHDAGVDGWALTWTCRKNPMYLATAQVLQLLINFSCFCFICVFHRSLLLWYAASFLGRLILTHSRNYKTLKFPIYQNF
jgi:hypothetical protein